MAKYSFYAADYPVGTRLDQLGFSYDSDAVANDRHIAVADVNGDPAFRQSYILNAHYAQLDEVGSVADQEVLYIRRGPPDASPYDLVADLRCADIDTANLISGWLYYFSADDAVAQIGTNRTGVIAQPVSPALIAVRMSVTGSTYRVRTWSGSDMGGIASNEPATWDLEVVDATRAAGVLRMKPKDVMFIGIGTAGDPAPVSPMPSPVVATPTGLNVTNITADGARLNWSQG